MKSSSYINVEKEGNIVISKNLYCNDFKNHITYVSSSEIIKSYTGDKDFFIGSKTIKEPEGLDKVSLDNNSRIRQKNMYCSRTRNRIRSIRK